MCQNETDQRKRARELFNRHLAQTKRVSNGNPFASLLPVAFYKVGLNSFEDIEGKAESMDRNQVLSIIGRNRSADIFYIYSGEVSNEETIDRIKLLEAIELKYKDLPNMQIVSGATGIAITAKPANVLFIFSVVYKFSAIELNELAAKHLETKHIGEVETLAKANFHDEDKLAVQIKRYRAKGFFIIDEPQL